MKKLLCRLSVFTVIFFQASVFAGKGSVTAGYSQGDFQGVVNKATGVNAKIRYEFDDGIWGGVSAFNYLEHRRTGSSGQYLKEQYGSATFGPSLRVNNWFSLYALAGIGAGSRQLTETDDLRYGVAYGAGIQVNPVDAFVIDIGYEQSRIHSVDVVTWTTGIGYRF